MFSKSKINEPGTSKDAADTAAATPSAGGASSKNDLSSSAPRPKAPPSSLSNDLTITGNIKTAGDVQVEGTVEGSVQRQDDPLNTGATKPSASTKAEPAKS